MLDHEKKDDARKQKYNKNNKYKNLDIIELILFNVTQDLVFIWFHYFKLKNKNNYVNLKNLKCRFLYINEIINLLNQELIYFLSLSRFSWYFQFQFYNYIYIFKVRPNTKTSNQCLKYRNY